MTGINESYFNLFYLFLIITLYKYYKYKSFLNKIFMTRIILILYYNTLIMNYLHQQNHNLISNQFYIFRFNKTMNIQYKCQEGFQENFCQGKTDAWKSKENSIRVF